jgi:hypothetical protein
MHPSRLEKKANIAARKEPSFLWPDQQKAKMARFFAWKCSWRKAADLEECRPR